MMKKGSFFHKLVKTLLLALTAMFFVAFPVYAEEETETAGSSLGKEVLEEEPEDEGIEMYSMRAARAAGWVQNNVGWRYYNSSGQYLKSQWYKHTDNQWYWLEADGYMATGWRKVQGSWHFFTSNGYWIDQSKYSKYENGTLKGIDVSKWQASINWKSVKQDGIQFAFIRLGVSGNDQNLDSYYEKNIKEANSAGVPVGVYYYSKATTVDMAVKEAQYTIDHMKGYLVSYPVAIDVEDKVQQNLGKDKLAQIIKAFCDEIRAAGYTPMLYTNENWYKNYINMKALAGEELWVARYNYYYDTAIPRGIWQSSSTSRVSGISGNVDLNFGYKDYTKIVTPRTSAVPEYKKSGGQWVTDSKGTWYQYNSGGYPVDKWEQISGKWYWFDMSGYVTTGWQSIAGFWYYMDNSGAMTTGWQKVGGKWYYMSASGVMVTGWVRDGSAWYYMNSSGVMVTGWAKAGSAWYYMSGSGVMLTGWQKVGNTWYYMNDSGAMQTGWLMLGKTWYYLDSSGAMKTGWQTINGARYYFYGSGAMATGKCTIGGKTYDFGTDGKSR